MNRENLQSRAIGINNRLLGGTQNVKLAPQVGLEPTTPRLTAGCSAIELLRNKRPRIARNYALGATNFYIRRVRERQGRAKG